MISFEKQLERIVAVLPSYYGNAIKYGWGDIEQLNQVLTTRNANTHYPLIWLNLGVDRFDRLEKTVTRNAIILIAVNVARETLADLNPTIQSKYFETCLEPITENLIQALESSGISQIMNNPIEIERIPKYSVQRDDKQIIDIWHIIKLEAEIKFSNQQCNINQIKFKNRFVTDNDNGGGGDNGGDGNNGGSFFFLSAGNSFVENDSSPNDIQSVNIINSSFDYILDLWINNVDFGLNKSSPNAKISTGSLIEVGTLIFTGQVNQNIPLSDGKWLVNKTGASGNLVNGNYRFNPTRTSPQTPFNNPLFFPDAPNPFLFEIGDDTIEPVIISVVNGVITQIFELPITGFNYE